MASEAEDFIARLHDQVSPGARAATSSLAQLEAQIVAQQQAAGQLETQLGAASERMRAIAMGNDRGVVNIGQYRKAAAEVNRLKSGFESAKASAEQLGAARGVATQVTAMESARLAIEQVADAMSELRAEQQLMVSAGAGQGPQFDSISASLQQQHGKLVQAQHAYRRLGGSSVDAHAAAKGMGSLGQAVTKAASQSEALATAATAVGGPLGSAAGQAGGLASKLGMLASLGPAAIVLAIVASVVALGAALASAVVSATKFAVAMADTARTNRLANQSFEMSSRGLKGVAEMIPRVAASTGLAQSEVRSLAQSFQRTRLPAKALENALEKLGTAKVGGASGFYLAQLRGSLMATGKVAPHLAAQFSHFEQIAAKRMLSLDKQSERLKRNFRRLFSGLKIESLLKELSTLVSVFDANTEAGQALKVMFEGIFQPLIGGATGVIPIVRRAMLYVVVYALQAYIAVKRFFKSPEGQLLVAAIMAVGEALRGQGQIAAFWAPVLAMPFWLAAQAVAGLMAMWVAMGAAWGVVSAAAGAAWEQITAKGAAAIKWLTSVNLASIGINMMQGLANGIAKGGAAVLAAIKSVVGGAIKGASAMLQERSPSRVFFAKGVNTARGMELGVASRASYVKRAIVSATAPRSVVNASSSGSSYTAAPAPRASADESGGVHFHNCSFFGTSDEQVREVWHMITHEGALAAAG